MKVLLISANRTEINMRSAPLGLACVAQAVRQAGHVVRVLDLVQTPDASGPVASAITDLKPDVIGISIRNIDNQAMRKPRFLLQEDNEVVTMARTFSEAPIVLGGAGYSMYPEAILAGSMADIGVEGEGEAVFTLLLERLRRGEPLEGLPGVHFKGKGHSSPRELIRDPDAFPLPDPDLLLPCPGVPPDLWLPVQTRRGCPMRCSYCSTGTIEGTVTRKRSPRSVVGWMAGFVDRGTRQFYFVDNTFNLPPSYASALCREIVNASLRPRWRCILYPWRLDEALAESMAGAGCVEAAVGFESGDDVVLRKMNKRFRPTDVARTCVTLKRQGIAQTGFLLLGAPGETPDSVENSLAFADSLGLDSVKVTIGIRIYPHTALAARAREEGLVTSFDDLLIPRFYIAPGLEDHIRDAVARYAAKRPNWFVDP